MDIERAQVTQRDEHGEIVVIECAHLVRCKFREENHFVLRLSDSWIKMCEQCYDAMIGSIIAHQLEIHARASRNTMHTYNMSVNRSTVSEILDLLRSQLKGESDGS